MRAHALILAAAVALGAFVTRAPRVADAADASPPAAAGEKQKDEYQQKAEDELAQLEQQLAELDRRIDAARGEAKAQLQRALDDLRKKRAVVRQRLDALRSSGEAAWRELREGIDSALEQLRKGLDEMQEEAPVET